jgi:hypothetical protein
MGKKGPGFEAKASRPIKNTASSPRPHLGAQKEHKKGADQSTLAAYHAWAKNPGKVLKWMGK